ENDRIERAGSGKRREIVRAQLLERHVPQPVRLELGPNVLQRGRREVDTRIEFAVGRKPEQQQAGPATNLEQARSWARLASRLENPPGGAVSPLPHFGIRYGLSGEAALPAGGVQLRCALPVLSVRLVPNGLPVRWT